MEFEEDYVRWRAWIWSQYAELLRIVQAQIAEANAKVVMEEVMRGFWRKQFRRCVFRMVLLTVMMVVEVVGVLCGWWWVPLAMVPGLVWVLVESVRLIVLFRRWNRFKGASRV